LESCVIAMHPGGALRWRRCTPNHRRPRMTLADGRVYLDLGLTTATDPVLLDSIALDSGEVLRTEPYYTSSIPQAMGDRLVALRLDPETGESELASYAPESGWRPLRAITNGLVDFQVLDRDRIVLIEGSAAQTELIAIDSEGEVLWRQSERNPQPSRIEPLDGGRFALISGETLLSLAVLDANGTQVGPTLDQFSGLRFGSVGVLEPASGRYWTPEYDYQAEQLTLHGLGIDGNDISVTLAETPAQFEREIELLASDRWICMISVNLHCTSPDGAQQFSADLLAQGISLPAEIRLRDSDSGGLVGLFANANIATTLEFSDSGSVTQLAREQFPSPIRIEAFSAQGSLISERQNNPAGPVIVSHRLDREGRLRLSIPVRAVRSLKSLADGADGGTLIFSGQPTLGSPAEQVQLIDAQGNLVWQRPLQSSFASSRGDDPRDAGLAMAVNTDTLVESAFDSASGELRWTRPFGSDLLPIDTLAQHYLDDPRVGRVRWQLRPTGSALELLRTRLSDGVIDIRTLLPCPLGSCASLSALGADGQLWALSDSRYTNRPPVLSKVDLIGLGQEQIYPPAAPRLVRLIDSANADQGLLAEQPGPVLAEDAYWYGFVADEDGHSNPRWWRLRGTTAVRGPGEHNLTVSGPSTGRGISAGEAIIGTAALQPMNDGQWRLDDDLDVPMAGSVPLRLSRHKVLSPSSNDSNARLWRPANGLSGFFYQAAAEGGRWGLPSGRWLALRQSSANQWQLVLEHDSRDQSMRLPGQDSGKTTTVVGSVRIQPTACHAARLQFNLLRPRDYPELLALNGELALSRQGSCQ
ncbi:MAG: hypothetical protein KDI71_20555, partial [Xanthomonadales bacterium]|nr:hypothetical protein [Xanthomonadales bacterium]